MNHVFISYTHKDTAFVDTLADRIQAEGFKVWRDNIVRPGSDWRGEIDRAIRESFVLIVVVSPDSKASEYVTYEWAFALGLGIHVIPLIARDTPLHPRMDVLQHIKFCETENLDLAWEDLIETLEQIHLEINSPTLLPNELVVNGTSALSTTKRDAPGVWLILERGPQPGQEWNLNKDLIFVGREITNDIVINDQQISRRHARLMRPPQAGPIEFTIEDMKSRNGTMVNQEKVTMPRKLKHGDVITLADGIILTYQVIARETIA